MKTKMIVGLFSIAAMGFVASNVWAQEEAAAPAAEAAAPAANAEAEVYGGQNFGEVQATGDFSAALNNAQPASIPTVANVRPASQVYGECEQCNECADAGIGIGLNGGLIGAGALARPGFIGGLRGSMADRRAQRARQLGAQRGIVQASPFANPSGDLQDWGRFRNYPYGYYPNNFGPSDMRVPNYNPSWQNYYPMGRRYHEGKHFVLDVF